MKYEEMSDQQINHAVGMIVSRDNISAISATGEVCVHDFNDSGLCVAWKVFDPCNSWVDVGPISEENMISVDHHNNGSYIKVWGYSDAGLHSISVLRKDIKRGICIVFLMMNEGVK